MKFHACVLGCGDKSPLSTMRSRDCGTSFQSADVSTHSQMLIRTVIVTLLLAIVSICLFGYVLHSQSDIFREFQATLLSVRWMLLACLTVWCGTFVFVTFSLNDLPLVALLLIAVAMNLISYAALPLARDALTLLAGVTLGRGARVLLRLKAKGEMLKDGEEMRENMPDFSIQHSAFSIFLIGLIVLLAFSAWWHLDVTGAYHGPRWMGLWNNPNVYGMLMGVGVTLAIGLLAQNLKSEKLKAEMEKRKTLTENRKAEGGRRKLLQILKAESKKQKLLVVFLLVAAGMMGIGLLFSYSRGAWLGTAVGLLYLAKAHGKLKWRFVLPGVLAVAAVVFCFWHGTADTGPWYLKRLDLSRPSAQHRVAAWQAAFQMMRDHPFGVGWNKAVETYEKNYLPPENGASAITTNDYLMLGTQLGLPGLLCFVVYVGLCLGAPASRRQVGSKAEPAGETPALPAICRAGALAMLVAFWFDGGLFKLATAAVFWILLELSQIRNSECGVRNGRISDAGASCSFPKSEIGNRQSEIDQSLVPPSPRYGATSTSAATK